MALKHIIVQRVFTISQLAHFLIKELEKDITKYNSKLVVITGDFFLSDPQITKEDKDWLYPQMIQAIKKVRRGFLIEVKRIILLIIFTFYDLVSLANE